MAEVRISEQATAPLQQVISRGERGAALRIYVDHRCHCGGVKYGMALGQALPGDAQFEVSGIPVSLTPEVSTAPGAAEIDYVESLLQSGFTLTNSEHACGSMAPASEV
ncbi:MAG: iron-sulfur cluster biosynthesis family protein [Georgenia sp.]